MLKPRVKLSRRKKLAYGACAVAGFFVLLELALALAGVRPLYLTHDPFVGFQPGVPLFVRDGDAMRTNPAKTCFFNPQTFAVKKPPNGYRVFCLGGSTTFGHPYDHRTAFGAWLRERLKDAQPDRAWEVVNCGGISYASYRECLLVQELVKYEPDLFVICTGHNEFLEERTYGELREGNRALGAVTAILARSRTGSLLAGAVRAVRPAPEGDRTLLKAEVDTVLEHSVGPSAYHRDEKLRRQVVEHFRHSLDRMVGLARSAGAEVVLVTPASNLRHFTPFKSEHGNISFGDDMRWSDAVWKARKARAEGRPGEAAEAYLAAAQIDPHFAQGLWEAGDALCAAGRYDEARRYFTLAADEDVCPLRATTAIQAAVKEVAQENGVPLVDLPSVLEAGVPLPPEQRILGDESFLDHVHPTIEGHRLLAWALFDHLAARGVVAPQESTPEVAERVSQRVLQGIDPRAHALALVQVIQVLSWAGKNDEALRLCDKAEKTCPGLSEVASYRGRLLEKMGREEEAIGCYREAVRRNPQDSLALARLGGALVQRNQPAEARSLLAAAIELTPASAPLTFRASLRLRMGIACAELKQWDDARTQFRAALQMAPEMEEAKECLARVEAEQARQEGDRGGR